MVRGGTVPIPSDLQLKSSRLAFAWQINAAVLVTVADGSATRSRGSLGVLVLGPQPLNGPRRRMLCDEGILKSTASTESVPGGIHFKVWV
jgi:hypothetical protein